MADTKKIEAVSGQSVQIVLQSAPGSTGYSWYLTQLDGGLALSGGYTIPPATPMPGAPSNQVFDFLATAPGKYKLAFTLLAPWRVTEAADTEVYEVEITAPAKTAAEDIASAMKGREFVRASSVNLGAAPSGSTVLKYAAPMAISNAMGGGAATQVIYAAPMAQANMQQPVVIYAAPMTQANMGPQPNVIYAAPMTQASMLPQPVVIYAAPMTQSAMLPQPIVIYAAPMVASAGTQPLYAAPMMQANQLSAFGGAQPLYAAPMASSVSPFPYPVVILYAAPVSSLYAAPMSMSGYGAAMMQPYAAPYTLPSASGYGAAMMQPYAAPYTVNRCC